MLGVEVSFLNTNFTLQPFYPQETAPVFIEVEFRWAQRHTLGLG
jgi:hypothetical protein